jgi:Regulated-SNARE-like domain
MYIYLHFMGYGSMSAKMSIAAGDKVFYYMTRDSLCFLTMAEAKYPKRLAFLYLDEIGDLVLGELLKEFGNQVCTMLFLGNDDWIHGVEGFID